MLSLSALEELALANNPTLEQARAGTAQAFGQRVQQGLYPNPEVGYLASEIGQDRNAGQQGVFASQEFVTADKLRLSSAVEAHRQRQTQHVVEAQEQRVLTAVRREFYAVLAAQRTLDIARELEEVSDQGVRTTEARLEAREGTRLDVLQARIEADRARLVARTAENDRRAAWRRMAAILGMPGFEPAELEGDLDRRLAPVSWDNAWARLSGTSPQLAEARAGVDRAAAALRRAEVQPVPNVFVQASVQQDFSTRQAIGGLQVGVPLPVFDRNQGNIASAHAEYVRACREVQRRELVLQQRLAEVYREYANAEAQVERYRETILPAARESYELSRSLFAAGETSYLQLLTAQRTFAQTNIEYVEQLGELWRSVVAIEGLLLTDGLAEPNLAMPIE
ncbi:MAG: TolC family protein [Planctomycetaceae bacterium]